MGHRWKVPKALRVFFVVASVGFSEETAILSEIKSQNGKAQGREKGSEDKSGRS